MYYQIPIRLSLILGVILATYNIACIDINNNV